MVADACPAIARASTGALSAELAAAAELSAGQVASVPLDPVRGCAPLVLELAVLVALVLEPAALVALVLEPAALAALVLEPAALAAVATLAAPVAALAAPAAALAVPVAALATPAPSGTVNPTATASAPRARASLLPESSTLTTQTYTDPKDSYVLYVDKPFVMSRPLRRVPPECRPFVTEPRGRLPTRPARPPTRSALPADPAGLRRRLRTAPQ